MSTYSKSFTAIGAGGNFSVAAGSSFSYAISGTFDQTWAIQLLGNGGWQNVVTDTAEASGTITADKDSRYRIASLIEGETAGTMVTVIKDLVATDVQRLVIPAAIGKVGATAGWVPAAASNLSLATLPAAVTAGTLVVPVPGLQVGDVITGLYIAGQIESAGAEATLDVELRKVTAGAADVVDASVASIAQIVAVADTLINSSTTRIFDLNDTVGADETFYFLVTGTTAALTDIALQSLTLEIKGSM
jgi:hypothetical protein